MDSPLLEQARSEWQQLLRIADQGDERCLAYRPLIQAILTEDRARVFPYISMWTLRLSLRPSYPWDQTGLPDIDYVPERPGHYQLDEGPAQSLELTVEALRPILLAAQVYPSEEDQE